MTTACDICTSCDSVFLFHKNGFDIRRCNTCSVGYTVIPPAFDLTHIYNSDYFQGGAVDGYRDYAGSEAVLHLEFARELEMLRRYTDNHTTLLELGSAYGFFLDVAQSSFDCDGLEVAADAVSFARSRGHRIHHGVFDATTVTQMGKRDVICMFDVIEHLPKPADVFANIAEALNPGGLLLLTTGDFDSLLARLFPKQWRLMTPPQHVFYYTKKSLTYLLHHHGLDLLSVDRPSKLVPIGLIFFQIRRMTGLRLPYFERMSAKCLKINLFDTIRIVAKKRPQ